MESIVKNGRVTQIAVSQISPSPFQARAYFSESDLLSLAKSIEQNGILQPLTVKKEKHGGYQLVAGERRLRAAKMAGILKVPCIIVSVDELHSAVLGLLENLQRQDLNCFEEARGMKELLAGWGCSQAEAAQRLGIAQPTLANKLRLLGVCEEQQSFCIEQGLTERHARAVLRLTNESDRMKILKKAAERKLTVAATELLVEQMLKPIHVQACTRKGAAGDVRLFVNTINRAVHLMKDAGLPATATRIDYEEYIEYVVRIPKQAPSLHTGS